MRTPANEQFQLDQLNDWRMLIDVVKARSMKIAAQNLGVAPSTVTRRIDKLETTMGTKFLLRSNQGLELTPEGRVAFANISHILAEYDAFLASFQRSQKEPPAEDFHYLPIRACGLRSDRTYQGFPEALSADLF